MTLPQSVAAQVARAAELQQSLQKKGSDDAGTPATPTSNDPPAPAPAPVQDAAPAAAPAPAPAPAATTAPAPANPPPTPDPWEQRYKVLQGKYNAEVPRLHDQVAELKRQMEELQKKPPAPPPALVTEKDRTDFGDDMIDLARRIAKEATAGLQAELDALKTENVQLKQTVENTSQTVGRSSFDTFQAQLTQLVPNWESVNVDPGFLHWLDVNVDRRSRRRYIDLFDEAVQARDAGAVAEFFKDFAPPPAPAPAPTAAPAPTPQPSIAPTTSNAAAQPASQQKRAISRADIANFYADVRRGLYQGRDAEREAIEREIFSATQEGRITG